MPDSIPPDSGGSASDARFAASLASLEASFAKATAQANQTRELVTEGNSALSTAKKSVNA